MARSKSAFRLESDSLGSVKVPAAALYGAQTQRAVDNFAISGLPMPAAFIQALALIKAGYASAHAEQGALSADTAEAVTAAALEVADGLHAAQFPVDLFQTGSGTSSNMNLNEVIAQRASQLAGVPVHPNDTVNRSQSSNDVVPAAIHLAALLALQQQLLPALAQLQQRLLEKEQLFSDQVKPGRTHLMDAMPVTFAQELSGWRGQLAAAERRVKATLPELQALALGATAVGTGVNATPELVTAVCRWLSGHTGYAVHVSPAPFTALSSQDAALGLSGALKTLAAALVKIANDLRWGSSGPQCGLGELELPALQPGSSIMPGKVNPVIPEAVIMAAYQVIGNDTAICCGAQSGNFQLNVALPLIAHNLLQSIKLLANALQHLADKVIAGLKTNAAAAAAKVARNPILVTALNERIGYELGARIAKRAYEQQRPVLEVAAEMTDLDTAELEQLLDPLRLTRPHSS